MNRFDNQVAVELPEGLNALSLANVQINVGRYCNQTCNHCHLACSPERTDEMMTWGTMEKAIEVVASGPYAVDITGGSPELNPHFRELVKALRKKDCPVRARTNLVALKEQDDGDLTRFLRDQEVSLVASLPCYLEDNVRDQRGEGVYENSIAELRHLNELGYGRDQSLALNLVYNPAGPFLPPPQEELEQDYREALQKRFGVQFTSLYTITNMPIGRFWDELKTEGRADEYMRTLENAFNPAPLQNLMCRHQISIDWDGRLYDCDFNIALGMPANLRHPIVDKFNLDEIFNRRIATGRHCFGCTAGSGSSCGGALT